jgi:hypothetical protein
MRIIPKLALGAAALAAAGGFALTGGNASATTLTCTGVQNQVLPPFGCGGDQLAYTAKGTLDLAVMGGNYWNSPVGFVTDSNSNPAEDFTVFAVSGSVTDGPGGLGEYVAMYTPDGKIASFTQASVKYTDAVPASGAFTVGTNVYCLSVENASAAKGARWKVVLRNCSTNGTFEYGNNSSSSPTYNSVSSGSANHYQVWAPVTGNSGLLMINESLSHGFGSGNTPYVLDDSGSGGSGTQAIAYPENDGLNQESSIIGCTEPITGLDTSYSLCP